MLAQLATETGEVVATRFMHGAQLVVTSFGLGSHVQIGLE